MIMSLNFRDSTPLIEKSVSQAVLHPDALVRADCNEDMEAIN